MGKLSQYIVWEILKPFIVISVILAGLFSSFNAARFLSQAVTESLGMVLIMKLIALKTIIAMEVLFPIAFYAAIIVALGRLHRDQEVIVLKSAGISENFLVRNVFLLALPLGLMVGALSIFGRPWTYETIYLLDDSASVELDIERYQAGRFYGNDLSGRVIYIRDKEDSGGELEGVFHYTREGMRSDVILARRGYQVRTGAYEPPQLHLLDGYMYRFGHGTLSDSIIRFSRFVYVPSPEIAEDYQRNAASTRELSESDDPADTAEFQWRMSRALSTILLAMIAIPLSRASPRQGKGERIITATVFFAIYYNLNGIAQTWVEQGVVPTFPGVWWLHALMLVAVVLILYPPHWRPRPA